MTLNLEACLIHRYYKKRNIIIFWMMFIGGASSYKGYHFLSRFSKFHHLTCWPFVYPQNRYNHMTLQAMKKEESFEDKDHHLFPLLFPSNNCTMDQVSPTAMAYIGDVVYELFARSRYVWPAKRTTDLQNSVVNLVRGMYVMYLISI
jgi:hypothetical protein